MIEKKQLFKNIAGMALSTGLAITTQGSSNLLLGVLGGIATGFAGNYLEKMEFNKMKNLLRETDPSDLNHDLQKVIVQAVEWAILNIQILYKKKGLDKSQSKELNLFTESLIDEIKTLNDSLSEKKDSIYTIIEKPTSKEEVFSTFDLKVETFPIIKPDDPYNRFFKAYFTDNLQLCFGELLKNDKFKPALIAYQREVYQNLDTNISKVIAQNDTILQKLTDKEERETSIQNNEKWKKIQKKVVTTSLTNVNPEFEKLLNQQLTDIKKDTELLINITSDIKAELEKVKGITKGISKELKQNWIAKNKVWILSLFALAVILIAGLLYTITSAPFTMNVGVAVAKTMNVHTEYPKLAEDALLRFYFPTETIDKEITATNEIVLAEIQSKLKNTSCKIELIDDYWELTNDLILIQNNSITLDIQPNDRLAKIEGKVSSRDLQTLISDANVRIDSLETITDKNGYFLFQIPIGLRKSNYSIRVEKEGYIVKEKYAVPGDFIELLISKKN